MAHKAVARPHATYIPSPPRPRRAPSRHAAPMAPPHLTPARPSRPAAKRTGRDAQIAALAGIDVALLAAVGLVLLVVGRHLPAVFHGAVGGPIYPVLVGGTFAVLVRAHLGLASYRRLHGRVGISTNHVADHAATVLAFMALGGAILLAAALLAWPEASIVALLAT